MDTFPNRISRTSFLHMVVSSSELLVCITTVLLLTCRLFSRIVPWVVYMNYTNNTVFQMNTKPSFPFISTFTKSQVTGNLQMTTLGCPMSEYYTGEYGNSPACLYPLYTVLYWSVCVSCHLLCMAKLLIRCLSKVNSRGCI